MKYVPNPAERELIDALRSGKYKQDRFVLRSENGYCCLGVACDLHDPNGWLEFSPSPAGLPGRDFHGKGENTLLPNFVRIPLNWSFRDGSTSITDRVGFNVSLSGLNDDGESFDRIADIIEAGLVRHKGDTDETPNADPA